MCSCCEHVVAKRSSAPRTQRAFVLYAQPVCHSALVPAQDDDTCLGAHVCVAGPGRAVGGHAALVGALGPAALVHQRAHMGVAGAARDVMP